MKKKISSILLTILMICQMISPSMAVSADTGSSECEHLYEVVNKISEKGPV